MRGGVPRNRGERAAKRAKERESEEGREMKDASRKNCMKFINIHPDRYSSIIEFLTDV